jgi:hypothetical protein
MSTIHTHIFDRVCRKGRGKVFVSKDFLDLGRRDAVDQALSRLAKAGSIQRLGRGLYYCPRVNPRLGVPLPPDPDDVAAALGRKTGSRVAPSGAVAANRLGLTTQVPAKPVYLTDGRGGNVQVGDTTFVVKHVAPKGLPAGHPTTAAVVGALRYLGKDAVDDRVIGRLRSVLSAKDRQRLLSDARYTTDWITDVVRRVASPDVPPEEGLTNG